MPFHSEDEFRGVNKKGNRSKDTILNRSKYIGDREKVPDKKRISSRSSVRRGIIKEDTYLELKKTRIPLPINMRINDLMKGYHEIGENFIYLIAHHLVIELEGLPYKRCSLCDLFTSNINRCEECDGDYPMCSSHKFRCICYICGLKCKVCKGISSMRFDNDVPVVGWSVDFFKSNRRKSTRKYDHIDFCSECKECISDTMEDNGITKVIAIMIIYYMD